MLLTIKLETSNSFRSVSKQTIIQGCFIEVLDETPRHTTIMNWVLKMGCYKLTKPRFDPIDNNIKKEMGRSRCGTKH